MTISYKLYADLIVGDTTIKRTAVQKTEDGVISSIPFDSLNADYQAYKKWIAAGNSPTPA